MNITRSIGGMFLAAIVAMPMFTMADTAINTSNQNVQIAIAKDFTATGIWAVRYIRSGSDARVFVPEPSAFGTALSTRYKLTRVLGPQMKPIVFGQEYDGVMSFQWDNTSSDIVQTYTLNYTLTPYFTSPVAVYEFWLAGGSARTNPHLDITFPSDWKVLSGWPAEMSISNGHITLDYGPEHQDVQPVLVAFQTGANGTIQQVGKYTISGSYDNVQKIAQAVGKLSDVDDLMFTNMGIKPPEKVMIVVDNLAAVGDVGYEAEALAARPNVIIFNDRLGKNKSTEEIAEILSHELLHLAMYSQPLFNGKDYTGRFLDEGLAVYFQGLIHKKIYTDTNKKILNEELERTHISSPKEAAILYESTFDPDFEGTGALGVGGAYRQAGLLFARFADKTGAKGFGQLFAGLRHTTPANPYLARDTDTIFNSLTMISGLTLEQLKYPGKSENDITGIVGRISHPENDEEMSATVVTNYIVNNVQHYFAGGINAPAAPVPAPVVAAAVPTPTTGGVTLTRNLAIGSSGPEVVLLQNYLETKGFLKMPVGTSKGYFGQATKSALIAYQKSVGLDPIGSVGPKTRAAISTAK